MELLYSLFSSLMYSTYSNELQMKQNSMGDVSYLSLECPLGGMARNLLAVITPRMESIFLIWATQLLKRGMSNSFMTMLPICGYIFRSLFLTYTCTICSFATFWYMKHGRCNKITCCPAGCAWQICKWKVHWLLKGACMGGCMVCVAFMHTPVSIRKLLL